MALPATLLMAAFSPQANLDLSTSGNTIGVPAQKNWFTLLPVVGLTGTGGALTLEGTTDALGTAWAAVTAIGSASGVSASVVTVDDLYKVASGTYTYFRWRVSTAATGKAILIYNGGGSQPQDVNVVSPASSSSGGTQTVVGPSLTFSAGTNSQVTNGGASVIAITGPAKGAYIVNPADAADQGVALEPLYVDPIATNPGVVAGGTNCKLDPAGTWTLPGPIPAGVTVRVNAATSGHKFVCVVWN